MSDANELISDKQNNEDRLAYILTFILIILSSRANALSFFAPIYYVFTFFCIIIFLIKHRRIDKKFVVFSLIYFIYSIFYVYKLGETSTVIKTFIAIYIRYILLSYTIIKIIGNKFYFYVENIITKLALISLPLYVIQLIIPKVLFPINRIFQDTFHFLNTGGGFYSNSFIFTFRDPHWLRNCGFMWEPGAFGAMLAIAIFLNLLSHNFKLNKNLYILFIALLTTISTTAYVNIYLILVFWLVNKGNKQNIIIFISFSIVMLFFSLQTDFIYKKIALQIDNIENDMFRVIRIVVMHETPDYALTLDRFASLAYDMQYIKDNYLIGLGFDANDLLTADGEFTRTNGISDYIVQLGLIGFSFLLFNVYKSFRILLKQNNAKGTLIFILLLMTISFSNPIFITLFFITFQIYYLAQDKATYTTNK